MCRVGDRVESLPHRRRDHRAHSPAATAVARVRRARVGSHLPRPGPPASRSGSHPSNAQRGACRARRRSHDACSRASLGRWDWAPSDCHHAPPHGAAIEDGPRPIDLAAASEPIQHRKVDQIPHARPLPVAQAPPAGHPRPAPEFLRQHCHGMPLRRTKTMPVRHARSGRRGRPPFSRAGELGRSGSIRSHNASGSSAAVIPAHATSPKGIRFRRFCYTL
jgi:hypothetical protein